jgi:hypothetical protein
MKSWNQPNQRMRMWPLIVMGLLMGAMAQAVYEPSQLPDPSRRWSVDLGISGGYDDNVYSSRTSDPSKQSSSTTALNPRAFLNIPLDQTFIGLRYSYDWIYYWERTGGEKFDQNHTADLIFSHRFNPRLQLDLTDNFRRGISPALTAIVAGVPYIRQEQGNYFYNNLTATLTYNLTRAWTLSIFNGWDYWCYDRDQSNGTPQDRNIYSPGAALNYLLSPATTLGLNFRMGIVDYNDPGPNDQRNGTSETVYLFLSHMFNPLLSAQLSGGGTAVEMGDGHGSSSPYASGAFTYRYGAHGTVSIGASYFLYTSDQYGFRTAETIASYLQLSHAITTKLTGRIGVSFIHSELNDPDFTIPPGTPTPSEDAWRVAVGATYAFTRWLYLDANYEFLYSSGVMGSGFDRNRVWAGIRVTY